MGSLHELMNAHWGHETQRSAEHLLGADLPTANAPCWKPALRFMESRHVFANAHSGHEPVWGAAFMPLYRSSADRRRSGINAALLRSFVRSSRALFSRS